VRHGNQYVIYYRIHAISYAIVRVNAIKNNLFNSKEFTKNIARTLNMVWKNFTIE